MSDGSRILYIEDNPQNMRLVRKILNHAGYTMLEAESGAMGLAAVEHERPDLILMDVNLPDIDGLELTNHIKSIPALSHIPVIALTANAMVGDRERVLQAGCDGYLPKPVARQDLLDTIAGFLAMQ
ncbi:MAG TPA: response regulator [Phototrophicaceae bacterium]|jgi:two-component system cell cycle response regulator DivK|nr:response regulator [Phototrophicaceae bacterium]